MNGGTGSPPIVEEDMAKPSGPNCPKCGKPSWDNRGNKKNPKAPDFKCAESCKDDKKPEMAFGWWEPKDAAPACQPAAPAPAKPELNGHAERHRWANFTRTYQRCRDVAIATWKDVEGADMVAAAATLFIQAEREGLGVEASAKVKPAPPPPPPPPADDFEEIPVGLRDDDDGLPF